MFYRYYLTLNVLSLLSEGSHSKRRDSTVENTYFNTAFQLGDKTVLRGLGKVEAFVVAFVTNCPGALHIRIHMYVCAVVLFGFTNKPGRFSSHFHWHESLLYINQFKLLNQK